MDDQNKVLLNRVQQLAVGGDAKSRDVREQRDDFERLELDRQNAQRYMFDMGARGTRLVPTIRCDGEALVTDSQIGFHLFGPHNGQSLLFRSLTDHRELLGIRLQCLCELCIQHICERLVGPFNIDLLAQGTGEVSFTRTRDKKITVSPPRQFPLLLEAATERKAQDQAALSAMKQEISELRSEVQKLSTTVRKLRDGSVRRDRSGRVLSLGELAAMTAEQNAANTPSAHHRELLRDLGIR